MILRHTLLYTAVKFLPALASVIALMVFTRLMTPGQFGEYSLTVTVAATLVAILANFLVIGLGRFEPAAFSENEKEVLHSTVLATALVISGGVACLIYLLGIFNFLPDISIHYLYLVVIFHASLFMTLSQKLINANLLPKRYGLSMALKNIILLVLGVASLKYGFGVQAVLISVAISYLLACLPALGLWKKTILKCFSIETLKTLWSYGAPLTLLYLFVMIISFSDRIFIDVMLGSSHVGLYSAAYDLTQYTIGLVASIIHLSAFPIILKAYEENGTESARFLLASSFKILLLIMIPVTFGFVTLREEIATMFLGDAYSSAALTLIPLLAISVLVSTLKSYHFDYTFQLTKNTLFQTVPPLIAAIINCILNYFFIKELGLEGAALSTLLSFLVYLFITIFLSRRIFNLPNYSWIFIGKVLSISFVVFLFISILNFGAPVSIELLLKILTGSVMYFVGIYFFLRKEIHALEFKL